MSIRDVIVKHRPWVNKKSYTDEVVQCTCCWRPSTEDDKSWASWAQHIEDLVSKEAFESYAKLTHLTQI